MEEYEIFEAIRAKKSGALEPVFIEEYSDDLSYLLLR